MLMYSTGWSHSLRRVLFKSRQVSFDETEVQEHVRRDRGEKDNHLTKGYMHLTMATTDSSQLWLVRSGGEKKKGN